MWHHSIDGHENSIPMIFPVDMALLTSYSLEMCGTIHSIAAWIPVENGGPRV
jgi:hypothetical protein